MKFFYSQAADQKTQTEFDRIERVGNGTSTYLPPSAGNPYIHAPFFFKAEIQDEKLKNTKRVSEFRGVQVLTGSGEINTFFRN